jgi:mRNA interferase MazF
MIKIEPDMENKLTKMSFADCFEVHSVLQERFVKQIGQISGISMEEIRIDLSKVLSIDSE